MESYTFMKVLISEGSGGRVGKTCGIPTWCSYGLSTSGPITCSMEADVKKEKRDFCKKSRKSQKGFDRKKKHVWPKAP